MGPGPGTQVFVLGQEAFHKLSFLLSPLLLY